MTNKDFVSGLRKLADMFEGHPDLALPHSLNFFTYSSYDPEAAKLQIRAFVEAVGQLHKKDSDEYIRLVAGGLPETFGFCLSVKKELIGCRKVTKQRIVLEEVWECGPILDAIPEDSGGK